MTGPELELVQRLADSSREFGTPAGMPESVSIEVALRLAEKAYRRGVQQGATYMHEQFCAAGPGHDYLTAIADWRGRGAAGNYADGELPPQPFTRRRGQR